METKGILVVGDVMLDIYYNGKVERISPEAPVPIVLINKTINKLGGAANVANNIAKLNSIPTLIGFCGNDINGQLLKSLLKTNNIRYDLTETPCQTISKMRVVAGIQQLVRVDFEETCNVDITVEKNILRCIQNLLSMNEVIILSDYGKGFASENICQKLINMANKNKKILIIDPKGNSWNKYRGATIVTPNVKELSDVYGKKVDNENIAIENAGKIILDKYHLQYLLVTRSEKGMTFFDQNHIYHITTEASEVFDVSGAGDTVVATLATAKASSFSWIEAVKIANKAAGIVVGKVGTESITFDELESSFLEIKENNKILSENNIQLLIRSVKLKGKKVVFTNGCFDIIHKGHIKYLQQAKSKGDILIIGLNSDASIKRIKGDNRPIKDEAERALILSVMEFVDFVVIFNEDTPYNLIKRIMPDVLVKGGDYQIENVIGREFAKETILIPCVEGYSTTSTIEKMKLNEKN